MKHFLNISDFSRIELRKILNFAAKIKKNENKFSHLFKKKTLGLIFFKQSIRTRLSFSIGMQKLGGNVIEVDDNQIGFGTRETPSDILKAMSQYLDILMIRNNNQTQLNDLAKLNILPIINGLSNYSHPCQIISDVFTIEENLGKIKNKKIVWLGDYNNVLTSLIDAAEIFEFDLKILIPEDLQKKSKEYINKKKLKYSHFYNDLELGINNADCVMTDTWLSMGEKKSKAKLNLLKKFQVNQSIMSKAKKKAIFMHCLPAHRNEEVTDSVIDGNQSVVWQQAKNRMYVQQSILYYLLDHVKK